MDKLNVLRTYFGHSNFRVGQSELIDNILLGRDVLGIMPTGAGKSLCYQVPALILDGLTLVVSPLISLMKDQVNALVQSGVKAAYINSSLSAKEYFTVLQNASNNQYKILYVAPERLDSKDFLEFALTAEIRLVTVDEAHCVSQWGQDFRPSYLKIVDFIQQLPERPIVSAFTATATTEVKKDIIKMLQLAKPYTITTGFDRENLSFTVLKPQDKFKQLLQFVRENKDKSGIIYCSTRKVVEQVCDSLQAQGFLVTRYHAGLDDYERQKNQEAFLYDRSTIMVATNAFGMGIDKSNVSFVIHYNMPKDLESYYQEAGRAGRDGESAECILLYSGQDVRLNQFLIENSQEVNEDLTEAERELLKEKDRQRLKEITFYCTTSKCLREYLLRYFGEKPPNYCGNCSNCNTQFQTVDITIEAQKIVSCVYRIKERNRSYGKTLVAEVLYGSKNKRIRSLGLDTLSTHGIMADTSITNIRTMIDFLVENDYLEQTNDQFPVLKLSQRSQKIIRDKPTLTMKLPKETPTASIKKEKVVLNDNVDDHLFTRLKELRNKFATAARVPAYIVFTDASLRDMCRKMPQTREEFLTVSGVGAIKADRYGDAFTALIREEGNPR